MAASKDDLFMEVGGPGSATTLSTPGYTAGSSTSITVGSTSNWPSATGAIFAIDEAEVVNGVEVQKVGTYNEYSGTVTSGTLVSDVEWQMGVGDRNYSPGALTRVYVPVSAERENRLAQGMAVAHNQDGTLKDNVVTTPKLLDKAATLAKINGGATAGVLTTDASGNVAVGAKTTDANGWTVYDYGAWKEYTYTTANGSASKSQYESWDMFTITLPVGVASGSIKSVMVQPKYIDYTEYMTAPTYRYATTNIVLRSASIYNGLASFQYAYNVRLIV